MSRLLIVATTLLLLSPPVGAQEPLWLFEGVLPQIYQSLDPVPLRCYTDDGHVLDRETLQASLELRPGDPVVLIRGGKVLGAGAIDQVVARRDSTARDGRFVHVTTTGWPEGVTVDRTPAGAEALATGQYDLLVVTDRPVVVLAPDPVFAGISWGVQDYVVRVGRVRYAVLRENDPRQSGMRGWQVSRLGEEGVQRVMADYTWWRR